MKGQCYWCEEMGHGASDRSNNSAHLRSEGKNNTHQADRDDFQRHDQPEEETYVGTFDVCSLEDVEESKNDARQITTVSASGLTPVIMMKQCEEIMDNVKDSAKQRNKAHEQN